MNKKWQKDGLRFDKIIVCHSLSIKCSRFPNYKILQVDTVVGYCSLWKLRRICEILILNNSSLPVNPLLVPRQPPEKRMRPAHVMGSVLRSLKDEEKLSFLKKTFFTMLFILYLHFGCTGLIRGFFASPPICYGGQRWRHWGLRQHGLLVPLELPRYEAGPREAGKLDGWHEKNSVLEGKVKEMEGVNHQDHPVQKIYLPGDQITKHFRYLKWRYSPI